MYRVSHKFLSYFKYLWKDDLLCYRGAGTYGDKGTCPNHILEQSLKNVLFLNIVPTKFKTKLFFVPSIFKYVPAPLGSVANLRKSF